MGLVIKNNVDQIQIQYVNSIISFFMNKKFSYDYNNALNTALDIYNQMITVLNNLAKSIADRYSQYPNFYKGYPILTFKSSGGSMWYFAYIRNDNNDIVVFDMRNTNQNGGKTFVTDGVQKSLDFMQRLLEVKI